MVVSRNTEEETVESIWDDAWHPHNHPELVVGPPAEPHREDLPHPSMMDGDEEGSPVPVHFHSPEVGWGMSFLTGVSFMGEGTPENVRQIRLTADHFHRRLELLRAKRRKIDLATYSSAQRQALILESGAIETILFQTEAALRAIYQHLTSDHN